MEEAIDRGVPFIVIPFASDQHSNAQRIEKFGIGVALDIAKLTKNSLKSAIETIMTGDYAKNVIKLREIVRDEPMKPVDKAVWWVEYVIRQGGTLHLDYTGRHVPFWKYLMLDFIAIAVLVWLVLITVLKFLVSRLLRGGKRQREKNENENKKKSKKNKKE